ncbi:MAG: thiol-disulfide oxidoreductase DCC family protein [Candidatus Acidiferrales bacterium]
MTDSRQEQTSTIPRAGWILYDGGCGFCFWWVHFWQKVIERRGFALKDLQTAAVDGTLQTSAENLLDDIRVLTSNGEVKSGADAYLHVTRRIWWAWPFYAVFSLPGLNWVLWRGYRWFNRNRYRISRQCEIPKKQRQS